MGGGTAKVRTFLWRHKAEGRSLVDAIKVPLTYSDHSSKSLRIQLKIDSFFIRAYNELTGQFTTSTTTAVYIPCIHASQSTASAPSQFVKIVTIFRETPQ